MVRFGFFFLTLLFITHSTLHAQIPAFDNFNKAQVTQSYQRYFCPADTLDTEWNGDLLTGDRGDLNEQYREAVLSRVYFIRALAGLTNRITLSSNLNKNAQRLSYLISPNKEFWRSATLHSIVFNDESKIEEALVEIPYFYRGSIDQLSSSVSVIGSDIGSALPKFMGQATSRRVEDDIFIPLQPNKFPDRRVQFLSPELDSIGIGSIEVQAPHQLNGGKPAYSEMSSGTLLMSNSQTTPQSTQPILWPPEGYVPHMLVGGVWSATLPGADMRDAFAIVTHDGPYHTNAETVPIRRNDNDRIDTIAWSMDKFKSVGKAYQHRTGDTEDRHYNVSIRDILYQGRRIDLEYTVIEFNPHPSLENSYFTLKIPPKGIDSFEEIVRYRFYTADNCLLYSDGNAGSTFGGVFGHIRSHQVRFEFSQSPEGPFEVPSPKRFRTRDYDAELRFQPKSGYYRLAFVEEDAVGLIPNVNFIQTEMAVSDTLRYSPQFGFRRLDEEHQELVQYKDFDAFREDFIDSGGELNIDPELGQQPDEEDTSVDELVERFQILKRKKRRCRKRKRRNKCTLSKCKKRCRNIRGEFREVKSLLNK